MRVLVLGATGNIGQQTLRLIKKLKYQLVGISFNLNHKLTAQIKTKYKYSPNDSLHSNVKNYDELIEKCNPDIVVNAIIGFAGLDGTFAVIRHKKTLCLANKESLVVAGKFVTDLAKKNQVKIYPIDSEHASLYEIINQTKNKQFKKLYITASGGPFYQLPTKAWRKVTFQQAINHPTWKMGNKISVDSATLINKCYEMVEAYWYFHTKNIIPLYHPQSLIHAIVEYPNQKLMFISKPNMKLPIYQALTGFKHKSKYVKPFDKKYQFETIDQNKWQPIKWAYEILKKPSSSLPIIINTANEFAVDLFSMNKIRFDQIIPLIHSSINHFKITNVKSTQQIYVIHNMVKKYLYSVYKQKN